MDIEVSDRWLRKSSSRNFSRPFPSPLSTSALNTPVNSSRRQEHDMNPPLSASHGSFLRHVTSTDSLVTKRLLNFDRPDKTSRSNGFHNTDDDLPLSLSAKIRLRTSSSDSSLHQELPSTYPIPYFRPNLWRLLHPDRQAINLDVFWPIDEREVGAYSQDRTGSEFEQHDQFIFPLNGLKPLLAFRNLRSLQLNGMLQSYQPLIWATCWLNPNLSHLHLEMALEPHLYSSGEHSSRRINKSWTLRLPNTPGEEPEYLGFHGTGMLFEEFGDGEYLDTQAINMARDEASQQSSSALTAFLPIRSLTLMNFAVDAWPFLRWFSPHSLEEIVFKAGCIDAGFYLPYNMMHVKVQADTQPTGIARVVKLGEIKVLELKKGKVVSRKDAVSRKSDWSVRQGPTLRHKISQIFPKLSRKHSLSRNKENRGVQSDLEGSIYTHSELQSIFTDLDIREAREGKKPAK